MAGVGIVVAFVFVQAAISVAAWKAMIKGFATGSRADDARSSIWRHSDDTIEIEVENPGSAPVIVGYLTARRSASRRWLGPRLVIRSPHWFERSRSGTYADGILGVAQARSLQRWTVPVADAPGCLRIILGHPGRLRIHEHALSG